MEQKKNKNIKQSQKIKIKRLIPKAYTKQLQLTKYLIGVSEPRNASQILSILKQLENEITNQQQKKQPKQNQNYQENPIKQDKDKEKYFLKRIRKNVDNKIQVILCKVNSQNKEHIINYMSKLQFIQKIQEVQLPSSPPLTKNQYEQWSKLWPINFVLRQIAKQIPHTKQSIKFLTQLKQKQQQDHDIYLIDAKYQKILLKQKGECQEGTIWHPIMNLLQKWPLSQEFTSNPEKYYYLTGLKLYTRKQLCGMCSMALIHSRLHSIYLNIQPSQTMDKIMGCPKLNHQIIMFLMS